MPDQTNTVRLHRVLRAPAARIYRAFLDADAMAKWLPPHGFTGKVHQMNARVGGSYRMSFTNFGTGKAHAMILLRKVACGTEVEITQEGLPPAIPVEFCYLGWQESLSLLAQLVEPEIPDGA